MLAKKDIEQIRGVVREEIDGALDGFAIIVNNGFAETVSKVELNEFKGEFSGLKNEFKEFKIETKEGFRTVNNRLEHQSAELSSNSRDLQDIKESNVHRLEFEDLGARVKLTETKLGIESGK